MAPAYLLGGTGAQAGADRERLPVARGAYPARGAYGATATLQG